jgi:hypothetical protein
LLVVLAGVLLEEHPAAPAAMAIAAMTAGTRMPMGVFPAEETR